MLAIRRFAHTVPKRHPPALPGTVRQDRCAPGASVRRPGVSLREDDIYLLNIPNQFPKWGMTPLRSSHRMTFSSAMFVHLPFNWRLFWSGKSFIDGFIKGDIPTP